MGFLCFRDNIIEPQDQDNIFIEFADIKDKKETDCYKQTAEVLDANDSSAHLKVL